MAVQLCESRDAGAAGAQRLSEGLRVSGEGHPGRFQLCRSVRAEVAAVHADAGEREGQRGLGEGDGAVSDQQRLEAGVRDEDLAAVPERGVGEVPATDQGRRGIERV